MSTEDYSTRLARILAIGLCLMFPKVLVPSAEAEAKPIIVKTIPLALNYKQPEQTPVLARFIITVDWLFSQQKLILAVFRPLG